MLGESLRAGWGADKDGVSALSWYLKAAKKGHPSAQLMAAYVYLSGEGWRSEPLKAAVWAEVARTNGEAQAASLLSQAGKKMPAKDLNEAIQLAQLCLQTGYRDCPE
jgi:TPR repeat protein